MEKGKIMILKNFHCSSITQEPEDRTGIVTVIKKILRKVAAGEKTWQWGILRDTLTHLILTKKKIETSLEDMKHESYVDISITEV